MDTKLLKQKILDLAIRGKLVPQDPNDEPASVLLEKIKKEKQELIKQGKIKKDKNESIIFVGDDKQHYEKFANGTIKNIEEEIPFEIPKTWCWCRLKDLAIYKKGPFGSSITKSMFVPKSDNSYKVYEQKNAIYKDITIGNYFISKEKYNELKSFEVFPNDIIVSCAGTIGESYILPQKIPKGIINQALMKITLYVKEMQCFYQYYFDMILKSKTNEDGKGSAMKNIPPFDILKKYLFPLPPLAEQERIVAKIEELFALVDKIEEEKQSLLKLIDKTKGKVLDLAMKGKLVEQDPNDDPASVLLEKIFEEKQKLAKEGKIKLSKDELLPPKISDDNDYYQDLPNNWKLTLLKTICEISTGNSINAHIKSEKYTKNTKGLPYIGTKDISYSNRIDYNNGIIIPFNEINNFRVAKSGSTLLCIEGGSCGRKFGLTNQNVCYGNKLCAFKSKIFDKFLYYYIQSNQFLNIFKSKLTGIIGGVNIYKIKEIYIPVPPINEQKRIVVKIENIFTKLEEIKDSL